MTKSVHISVSGLARSAAAEKKCLDSIKPFIDKGEQPTIEVVFPAPNALEVSVRIAVENFTLLRHQKQLEGPLTDELKFTKEQVGRSTQFNYVPGDTEAAIATVTT